MSRTLTPQEMFAVCVCGLGTGYDVDDEAVCPVQLCHLVEGGEHEKMLPICGATTLWFYDRGVEPESVITCVACLVKLPDFVRRAHRRAHL
jgi:hypothetical protein